MAITMVGDQNQMMYRFAGANPEIMLTDIERILSGKLLDFKLKTNYRSTETIIDTCNRLIEFNYEGKGGSYSNAFFNDVQARPDAGVGDPVIFTLFEDADSEAESVANTIQELVAGGTAYDAFFVAGRTRNQLAYLEGALSRRKIPYINIAGGSFWQLAHVADLIAYLRVAVNPQDSEAFKRIYNKGSVYNQLPFGPRKGDYSHIRYLGNEFINETKGVYANIMDAVNGRNGWRYWNDQFRSGARDLVLFVDQIIENLKNGDVDAALRVVVDYCYADYLKAEEGLTSEDEAENGKLSDLETVIDIAAGFDAAEAFLAYVEEMVQAASAIKNKSWDGYVVLSTVHRLKGLERDVVFGVGLSEGVAVLKNTETPAGLLPHTFSLIEPPQKGVLPTGGMGSVEDERCIAYVLVSRAKSRVFLSGIEKYRNCNFNPSRFVYEMGLWKGGMFAE